MKGQGEHDLDVCGEHLLIGQSKVEVLVKLDQSYCEARGPERNADLIMAVDREHPSDILGSVAFKEGKVVSLTQYWNVRITDEYTFAQTIIDLFGKLEREKHTSCTIRTANSSDPRLHGRTATLSCDWKQVIITQIESDGTKEVSILETVR